MKQLEDLAAFAVANQLWGSSLERNSILKPLAIIFGQLELYPKPEDRDMVRASVKEDVFRYLADTARRRRYTYGAKKRGQVDQYVDHFFDEVLDSAHHGDVNRLLQRQKLLRSAYITYYRAALGPYLAENAKQPAETIMDKETEMPILEEE